MAKWKDVAGYEGLYLVSDEGDVMSLPRVVYNGRGYYIRKATILKPGQRGRGHTKYQFVVLSDGNTESIILFIDWLLRRLYIDLRIAQRLTTKMKTR